MCGTLQSSVFVCYWPVFFDWNFPQRNNDKIDEGLARARSTIRKPADVENFSIYQLVSLNSIPEKKK
uniref:Putative ovule protein n=1 Tax=Solanum chacoense TaxID=4108 RepID=A0A0V0HC79_SOLCH